VKLDVPHFDHIAALLEMEFQIMKSKGVYVDTPTSTVHADDSSGTLFARLQQFANPTETEVDHYLKEGISPGDTDPLQFWKLHCHRFPNLSLLARKYLAIPATSGGVERVFSISGFLNRARRSSLSPENMKNLILYRNFLC
jgi:hypothetical protein